MTPLQKLFPPAAKPVELDHIYTVPELAFPTEGVSLASDPAKRRPYIYFNMVSSVDGRAITAVGSAEGLGNATDRRIMHRIRLASDAVMVGGSTFRRDPFVPTFNPDLADERKRFIPETPQPWGIVVSKAGDLPLDKKFFQEGDGRRIVAVAKSAPADREAYFGKYAEVVRLSQTTDGQLDLAELLAFLYAEKGIKRLLCEGGPSLNYELISRQMADELFWTLASRLVLAGDNSSIVHGKGKGFGLADMPELKLISLYEENSQLFFRYRFAH